MDVAKASSNDRKLQDKGKKKLVKTPTTRSRTTTYPGRSERKEKTKTVEGRCRWEDASSRVIGTRREHHAWAVTEQGYHMVWCVFAYFPFAMMMVAMAEGDEGRGKGGKGRRMAEHGIIRPSPLYYGVVCGYVSALGSVQYK